MLPRWLRGKELVCQWWRPGFNPWVEKIPWRRTWQPTLVFLENYEQGSLVGYSPQGSHKSDMTDGAHMRAYLICIIL